MTRCSATLPDSPVRCTREANHAPTFHRNGRRQWPVEPLTPATAPHYTVFPMEMFVDINGVPRLGMSGNPANLRAVVIMEREEFLRLTKEAGLAHVKWEVLEYE